MISDLVVPLAERRGDSGSFFLFNLLPAIVLFVGLLMATALFADADTLWQIRAGEWVITHHRILYTDPFSYTMRGAPWPPHQWLGQVLLAVAYDLAGWSGILVLTAASTALAFGLLIRYLSLSLAPGLALIAAALGLSLCVTSMLARPHELALPCMVLWAGGLVTARARNAMPPFALLIVMTLWANLHGSFMAGLFLAGTLGMEAVYGAPSGKKTHVAQSWGLFIGLAVLAACLTPQGVKGIIFPFELLGLHSLGKIQEWQPITLGHLQPLEDVILLALYLGLTGKIRFPAWRVVLVMGLLHESFAHARAVQQLGIMGPLLLAGTKTRSGPPLRLSVVGGTVAVVVMTVALSLRLLFPAAGRPSLHGVMSDLPRCLAEQPVLNTDHEAGTLIFFGISPFIDDRVELYRDNFLNKFTSIAGGDVNLIKETIAYYGIMWAALPVDSRITMTVRQLPGWHVLRQDRTTVVLVHGNAAVCGTQAVPQPSWEK